VICALTQTELNEIVYFMIELFHSAVLYVLYCDGYC